MLWTPESWAGRQPDNKWDAKLRQKLFINIWITWRSRHICLNQLTSEATPGEAARFGPFRLIGPQDQLRLSVSIITRHDSVGAQRLSEKKKYFTHWSVREVNWSVTRIKRGGEHHQEVLTLRTSSPHTASQELWSVQARLVVLGCSTSFYWGNWVCSGTSWNPKHLQFDIYFTGLVEMEEIFVIRLFLQIHMWFLYSLMYSGSGSGSVSI